MRASARCYVVTHAWHMRRALIAFAPSGLVMLAAPLLADPAALSTGAVRAARGRLAAQLFRAARMDRLRLVRLALPRVRPAGWSGSSCAGVARCRPTWWHCLTRAGWRNSSSGPGGSAPSQRRRCPRGRSRCLLVCREAGRARRATGVAAQAGGGRADHSIYLPLSPQLAAAGAIRRAGAHSGVSAARRPGAAGRAGPGLAGLALCWPGCATPVWWRCGSRISPTGSLSRRRLDRLPRCAAGRVARDHPAAAGQSWRATRPSVLSWSPGQSRVERR